MQATLTLPGSLDSLKQIRDFVLQAAAQSGLDHRAAYRLNLAVDEIATNIIIHAYEESGLQGEVLVKAEADGRSLTIRLEDTGPAYDPSSGGQEAYLDTPLDQRPEGGLGVFLASHNVDQFTYERIGERNLHTFVVQVNRDQPKGKP